MCRGIMSHNIAIAKVSGKNEVEKKFDATIHFFFLTTYIYAQ
jgi:hypothetical protein